MQKCYNKMNKLLDDSAKVANKLNATMEDVWYCLPTCFFPSFDIYWLRHVSIALQDPSSLQSQLS